MGKHSTPEGERSTSEKATYRRHADPNYTPKHAKPEPKDTGKK